MALSNNRILRDSSKVQTCVDETATKITTLTSQGHNEWNKCMHEEEDGSQSSNGVNNDSAMNHSPPLCGSGNGYVYKSTSYQLKGTESLIDFQENEYNHLIQGSESLLNFQQSCLASNEKNLHQGYHYNQWNHISPRSTTDSFQSASAYRSNVSSAKEKQHDEISCEWLYAEHAVPDDSLQKSSAAQESVLKKRSFMGENMQAAKKPCTSKTAKTKSNQSKDPRSVVAKNRRERICERLKLLQELVPNGSKVDLVTMLEKAISYVKFLQLQVKVLAADEFWPVQGGKAPDISQVRQAIDAILSSQ